ncbi:MAG TPA: jacalin-like lectin [Bacteroidia bacterium]|jgi:hypothetical protein|nr:jacalin-like lectin [Bacteroidia bacterium]
MKKLNLIAAVTVSIFLFSCKKETIQPMNNQVSTTTTVDENQDGMFTEKNSAKYTWDQLPEKLKSAEVYHAETTPGTANKTAASYLTQVGPWGGGGGDSYSIYPKASTDKIYAIGVRSKNYVEGLSIWYIRTNGSIYSYVVGGTGGDFYLQPFAATERITAIAGKSATYLDRLTIYTNKKVFSYGGNGGTAFYAGANQSQVLGFYGGAKTYIDRIGAYLYSL